MKKMIKQDMLLYSLIGFMIVGSAYIINEQFIEGGFEEYRQSEEVANNWAALNATQTSCDEMNRHLIGLGVETFDGKELIIDAIMNKYVELGC